tara:strand:- start:732 stop:923 length:192 start_codon:yes stop_codon:yes gene_type:complete
VDFLLKPKINQQQQQQQQRRTTMLEAAHKIALFMEPLFTLGFSLGALAGIAILINHNMQETTS